MARKAANQPESTAKEPDSGDDSDQGKMNTAEGCRVLAGIYRSCLGKNGKGPDESRAGKLFKDLLLQRAQLVLNADARATG